MRAKVHVTISLDPDLADEIDKARGEEDRSHYVERMIREVRAGRPLPPSPTTSPSLTTHGAQPGAIVPVSEFDRVFRDEMGRIHERLDELSRPWWQRWFGRRAPK